MSQSHVFISYNSDDSDSAYKISKELTKRGIRIWLDKDQIGIGDTLQECLEEGLSNAYAMVVILGESVGPWQNLEVRDGIRDNVYKGLALFPILLKGGDPDKIPRLLSGILYLDLREGVTDTDMDRLAFAIGSRNDSGIGVHVRELHAFERDFLQVLLHEFSLFQLGNGVRLEVAFNHRSLSIGTREARRFIRLNNPGFDATGATLKDPVLQVYSGKRQVFNHKNSEFPFRYASGGIVPILEIEGVEYYCLFLRGVHPIGWNLANGGCNSVDELRDPTKTIVRELQEELIIVDSRNWYIFGSLNESSLDRPEFAVARDYWNRRFDELGLLYFEQLDSKICRIPKLGGPDVLKVEFLGGQPVSYDSLYVSVTTEDFGIEVDRVLELQLAGDDLVICDGEIDATNSVNRPIGLFRTESFNPTGKLVPQFFYYNAKRYEGEEFENVVHNDLIPDMKKSDPALPDHVILEFEKAAKEGFCLCPIAQQLIPRVNAFRAQR